VVRFGNNREKINLMHAFEFGKKIAEKLAAAPPMAPPSMAAAAQPRTWWQYAMGTGPQNVTNIARAKQNPNSHIALRNELTRPTSLTSTQPPVPNVVQPHRSNAAAR
jgi:hypothetical protein